MRTYFRTKESYQKQLIKNRLRNRRRRRLAREKLERELKLEIERVSAISKLAEMLATQVSPAKQQKQVAPSE